MDTLLAICVYKRKNNKNENMKKITHVIIGLKQGGSETMLYKLCGAMDKSKYDITVISLMGRGVFADRLEACGVNVYTLDLNKFNAPIVLLKYIKLIRKIKPDVVHSWMYHANVISMLCKPFYRKARYMNSIRTGLENYDNHNKLTKILIRLNAKFSRFSDLTLNNSKKSIIDHEKIGFKKQVFIPNGFDENVYKPNCNIKNEFYNRIGLCKNSKIIGIIARDHPDKNILRFIELANLLLKKDSSLRFLIAGKGCSTINVSSYLDDKNNLEKFFVFESVESSQYLTVLDAYLSTSKTEGFPNILAEAMLCEVPVVASNVGDCKDVVNIYGEIFEPSENSDEIVNKVLKVLKTKDIAKKQMREHIVANFSIESILEKHEKLYHEDSIECVE